MDAGPGGLFACTPVPSDPAGIAAAGNELPFTDGGRFSGSDIGGISSFVVRRNFSVTGVPFAPSSAITERTVATTISHVSRPNNLWPLIDNKLSLILIFPLFSADNGVLWTGWGLNPSNTIVQTKHETAKRKERTLKTEMFYPSSSSMHHYHHILTDDISIFGAIDAQSHPNRGINHDLHIIFVVHDVVTVASDSDSVRLVNYATSGASFTTTQKSHR